MAILLTNDDGIDAPGLAALTEALVGLDDIYVSAPYTNQSAMSAAITIERDMTARRHPDGPGGAVRHSIDGTPTDAVMYGLRHVLGGRPPRLVVSGINLGSNLGRNLRCSGTVSAAFEALLSGVPAVATSAGYGEPQRLDGAKHYTRLVVEKALEMADSGRHDPFLLNLNVPDKPLDELRGLMLIRHGQGGWHDFIGRNEDGVTYGHDGAWTKTPHYPDGDCDAAAYLAGYAVVTPLRLDMTDHKLLGTLRDSWGI